MPEISRFYGIIIYIYFNDHNPPHIHAYYNDMQAIIGIKNNALLKGKLPPKALALITEWMILNHKALLEDWELASQLKPLKKIKPLE